MLKKILKDLKEALKSHQKDKVLVLRSLLAALQNEQIKAGKDKKLSDEQILSVLFREAKKRKESIELYKKGSRQDLAEQEKKELELISAYLPKQLSQQEIVKIIKKTIEKIGAKGPQDIGKVMKLTMEQINGRADGKMVKDLVLEKLRQL